MSGYAYPGGELELFEKARGWKRYWCKRIEPFVHGAVLEVGAGMGANTQALAGLAYRRWVALEPDRALAERIVPPEGGRHSVVVGTVESLPASERFDTVLYLDVLEHIREDRAELDRAGAHLTPGGVLVVLAPALPFLFTPFDRRIGHFRRYTKRSLRSIVPPGFSEREMTYLDSVGLLASLGNRLLLRAALPTETQILFWDRWLVPCSVRLDQLLFGAVGKSVLAVWAAGASLC
jgi:SAM-dependent methyltransferase